MYKYRPPILSHERLLQHDGFAVSENKIYNVIMHYIQEANANKITYTTHD